MAPRIKSQNTNGRCPVNELIRSPNDGEGVNWATFPDATAGTDSQAGSFFSFSASARLYSLVRMISGERAMAASSAERAAVEAEAASLPLPGLEREIAVRWDEPAGAR